jgi:biopolymer transport protein TolR
MTDDLRSEINITPLVDVVLVLLVIFMVVTPLLRLKVPVELPLARTSEKAEADTHQVVVSIDAAGTVRVHDKTVAGAEQLDAVLRDLLATHAERVVFLEADASRPYAEIVAVIDAARAAGVERVGILTRKPAVTLSATPAS